MRHNVLFATAFATLVSTSAFAADLPGKGITVQPVQSTISEESFQTLIVSRALEKLGYTVNTPSEVDYNVGYTSIASGDATFTAVNWQPLHDDMYAAAGGDKKFYREGTFVTGAAQGYLIDKKTADQYHITNIEQLKDPKIARLFDTNGDGKAGLRDLRQRGQLGERRLHPLAAKPRVAAISSCTMPGSVMAWPASGTTRRSASGQARFRSKAFFTGVTTS